MRLQTLKQSFPMKFCLLFIRLNLSKLNQINIRWILITFELFELTPGKSLRNWSISPLPAFCEPNVRLFDIIFFASPGKSSERWDVLPSTARNRLKATYETRILLLRSFGPNAHGDFEAQNTVFPRIDVLFRNGQFYRETNWIIRYFLNKFIIKGCFQMYWIVWTSVELVKLSFLICIFKAASFKEYSTFLCHWNFDYTV